MTSVDNLRLAVYRQIDVQYYGTGIKTDKSWTWHKTAGDLMIAVAVANTWIHQRVMHCVNRMRVCARARVCVCASFLNETFDVINQ